MSWYHRIESWLILNCVLGAIQAVLLWRIMRRQARPPRPRGLSGIDGIETGETWCDR